jgi:hypothetical protein
MDPSDQLAVHLVGMWDRPVLRLLGDDGYRLSLPDASGRLVYTTCGHLIAIVSMPQPAVTESGSTLMPRFLSYSGRYEVADGAWVLHHVDISSLPTWVDTTVRRQALIDGDFLWLDTPPFRSDGRDLIMRIQWSRATSAFDGSGR